MQNFTPLKVALFSAICTMNLFMTGSFAQDDLRPIHQAEKLSSLTQNIGTIENVVRDLFQDPNCFSISNVKTNDNGNGIDVFKKSEGLDIGLESGIVLSTGNVSQLYGSNLNSSDASSNNNLGGDDDLAALVPFPIFNAVYVEFDFIPTSDKMAFNLVFGSEEYPEYVCSRYNDAVGIFLEKIGTNQKANVAFVPGTDLPISINTLNNGQSGYYGNSQLCLSLDQSDKFIENPFGSPTTRLDGYSKPLSMQIEGLETCAQYRLKIVIADGADKSLDSAIFIQNKSIVGANGLIIEAEGYYKDDSHRAVERCEPAAFTFVRPPHYPIDVPFVVDLKYGGNATFGVDYEALPDQITIPAGETEFKLDVNINMDFGVDMFEGDEILSVTTNIKECSCSRDFISQYLIIENRTPNIIDYSMCPGDTYVLPDGISVTEPGIYTGPDLPDTNYPNCDQVYYAVVTINPTFDEHYSIQFCPNTESVLPNGTEVFEAGDYEFNYFSKLTGCDSTETYHVQFFDESYAENTYELCEGDDFILPGNQKKINPNAGEYNFEWVGKTINGCDSTIVTNLVVRNSYLIEQSEEFCEGDTFTDLNGENISNSTTKKYAYKTKYGCDSIITISYLFHDKNYITDQNKLYFCEEDKQNSNFDLQDDIGSFNQEFKNQYGCDSIVTYNYEIIKPDFTESIIDLCGNYDYTLPSGKIVSESGMLQDTLVNIHGCDSIVLYKINMMQIMIANAFSPNGDGMNDQLFISKPDVCGFEEFNTKVYSRWGELIFEGNNPHEIWDGMLANGQKASTGIYLVTCNYMLENHLGQKEQKMISSAVNLLM